MTSNNPYLVSHDQLPAWCHDNPAIINGYRRVGGSSKKLDQNTSTTDSNPNTLSRRTNGKTKKASEKENGHGDVYDTEEYEVNTFYKCWRSIWDYWHNETVNIHTHLWGSILSLTILILHVFNHFSIFTSFFNQPYIKSLTHSSIFLPPILKSTSTSSSISGLSSIYNLNLIDPIIRESDWKDTLGFTIFLLSAVCCLGLSATFHTCVCHSQKISKKLNQGDYVGIVVLITGSFVPAVHYGFYCDPHWQLFYICSISILGSAAIYTVINPVYSTSSYRPLRTSIFIALGLSAIFPVSHLAYTLGLSTLNHTMGLNNLVLSGALYIAGALLYANRIPEKFFPGKFDYLGASHQIFHVFILLAAFCHYVSLRRAFNFWHSVTLIDGISAKMGVGNGWFGGILGKKVEDKVAEVRKEAVCFALDRLRR